MPEEPAGPEAADRLRSIAHTMRADAVGAEVVAALDAAGVPSIVLKGSTHAFLARPGETRTYVDTDLLIPPDREADAHAVLRTLGFTNLVEGTAPSEHVDYGTTWVRGNDPPIDLHSKLPLTNADPGDGWRVLRATAEAHTLDGRPALALSTSGRLLEVALHTAKTGLNNASPNWDVPRALDRPLEEWRDAADLAARLDATAALAAGLRTSNPGRRLADELGLPDRVDLYMELSRSSATSPAKSVGRFVATRGLRPRMRLAARSLVPTPASLRLSTPVARRGRLGLLAAYLLRPFVVAARLPRAVTQVRGARERLEDQRSTRTGSDARPRSTKWSR